MLQDARFLVAGIAVAALGVGVVAKSAKIGQFFAIKKKDVPDFYYRAVSLIGGTEETPQVVQMSTALAGCMMMFMGAFLVWLAYF